MYVAHICYVVERLRQAYLTVNVGKCCVAQRRLKDLGHILEDGEIVPDDDKIKAIVELNHLSQSDNCAKLSEFWAIISIN